MMKSSDTQPSDSLAHGSHAGPGTMAGRERLLRAMRGAAVDRPPVWLMRQAGRALPEYRQLKERYSFVELVQNPELAAEVTLQPIRRFGFDAAILFSDILVVCEGLGQAYKFREGGGVQMEFSIEKAEDVRRLTPETLRERLAYTTGALNLLRRELGKQTALLGFAGSPWTLANFMMEGGSAREFVRAKGLFHENRPLFDELMEKLTRAVGEYLEQQIEAGVDAVQIFDSVGGILAPGDFEQASARWMRQIITRLAGRVPVIVFSRGANGVWDALASLGADVVSVDWTVSLSQARRLLPREIGLQGNLDPAVLTMAPSVVRTETQKIMAEMAGENRYIFNLGHGLPPAARLESIEALVTTIRSTV